MAKPKNVDEYVRKAPRKAQGKLKEIRKAIREAAPAAVEGISYGMPYYSYMGRLAYFGVHTAHIGLYIPPPIIEDHREELAKYELARGTVRFPLGEPLPIPLIMKLVKARAEFNEAKALLQKN